MKKVDRWLYYLSLLFWSVALVGYFGPWVGHQAAALAWNAYDLFDLLRLLPQIETGALIVNLQALRLPLVGLGVLLPFLLALETLPWRVVAGGLGALLAFTSLPGYPEIIGAWSTPGWRVPFWWGVGGMAGAIVGIWLAPRLLVYRQWLVLAWILLTGVPAAVTFYHLLPALSELHAVVIHPGWGFWSCEIGLLSIALIYWYRSITVAREEGHYG